MSDKKPIQETEVRPLFTGLQKTTSPLETINLFCPAVGKIQVKRNRATKKITYCAFSGCSMRCVDCEKIRKRHIDPTKTAMEIAQRFSTCQKKRAANERLKNLGLARKAREQPLHWAEVAA